MFQWISDIFAAIGAFITGLFSSVWSGVITVVVLICVTAILISLIVTYQKQKNTEHHIVNTDGETIIIEKQPEAAV